MTADDPASLARAVLAILGGSGEATSVVDGLGRDLFVDYVADTGDDSAVSAAVARLVFADYELRDPEAGPERPDQVLLAPRGDVLLFGGDTAYHEGFREVGPVDLAILGIGAYDPYVQAHATPEQAWAMADHARADRVLPMHHSTFRLGLEPLAEPMERLLAAAGRHADRVVVGEIGGMWVRDR